MEKYGFVYIWYDKKRKMFYIGSHWGDEKDRYICSSTWMRNTYNRHKNDFRRETLSIVKTNRKDLLDEEQRWLNMIKDHELGKKYYNLKKLAGYYWWMNDGLTTRQRLSLSHLGKPAPNKGKKIPNISKSILAREKKYCDKCKQMICLTQYNKFHGDNCIVGKKFGRWFVESYAKTKNHVCFYNCKCDCGNKKQVNSSGLRNGSSRSCSCLQKEIASKLNYNDVLGKKFGRWIVLGVSHRNKHGNHCWRCKCDCGNEKTVSVNVLLSGTSRSCGCLKREIAARIGRANKRQYKEI